MKEQNIFDDPFIESLAQLAPGVPDETKSRLLYAISGSSVFDEVSRKELGK